MNTKSEVPAGGGSLDPLFGIWQPIETAPKNGKLILVCFGSKGIRAVSWDDPFGDGEGIWCVDDDKHGPYPLRGYQSNGPSAPTHWMPFPDMPNDGTQRPGTPDGSLATETRKPGSLE